MKTTIIVFLSALWVSPVVSQTLDATQTKQVFDFLFGPGASSSLTISEADKQKAMFFLSELTESSCQMSSAEALLTTSLKIHTKLSDSIEEIVKELIVKRYDVCYQGAKDGYFYESVRATLARNWKSAFEIRKQTGEW